MNKAVGVLFGAGLAAATAVLLRSQSQAKPQPAPQKVTTDRAERVDADVIPLPEDPDPLGSTHALAPDEAERIRAEARLTGGKATSSEREGMYTDLNGVGESGSMGSETGQEDRNPVGRHA